MTYIFESGLAHHIEGLIQQKRADGYAYNSEEKLLKRFDTFCVQNYPELTTVTYEMAAKWSEARPGEGDAYHNRCMSMVKVLSEYILSLGQEAYIPNFFCKAYRPVLYIPQKRKLRNCYRKWISARLIIQSNLDSIESARFFFSYIFAAWSASVRRAIAKMGAHRPG